MNLASPSDNPGWILGDAILKLGGWPGSKDGAKGETDLAEDDLEIFST